MLSGIKKIRGKRGVSIMVGYVLLITLAIVMGIVAYNWMKTYLPREVGECPDGVSLFVKEAGFNSSNSQLILTLKNNGRFDIHGYFVYARNSSSQEIATIDLSSHLNESFGGAKFGSSVRFFSLQGNILKPGEEATHIFDIPLNLSLYSISIIPTRFEKEENKEKFVTCGNSLTNQVVGGPVVECVPETCSSLGYTVCNPPGWDKSDDCGGTLNCGSCPTGQFCNTEGTQCSVPPADCGNGAINPPETCDDGSFGTAPNNGDICTPTYGSSCTYCSLLCETVTIQGPYCGDGNINSPPEACDDGANNGVVCTPPSGGSCNYCSLTCQIVTTTIGNGVCDTGETCAQEPTACQGQQATCSSGNICISGSCQPISGGIGCTNYCISLLRVPPYTTSTCVGPPGQCGSQYKGTLEPGGNIYCPSGTVNCCCIK